VKRLLATGLASVVLALGSGCATTASMLGMYKSPPNPEADPWENWNRKVYAFNDAVDTAVIRPVAEVYANIVPQPVRTGVTNFYGNFADAWSAVNNLLQGKLANGAQDFVRVGTNTLFGIGGLFDVATELGIDSQREDFGQTLGRWGMGPGPYIVWPLLGPSTVRDSLALPVDRFVGPALAFSDTSTQYSIVFLGLLNERANLLTTGRMLDDMALDRYSFVRDAFLQRRRSLVHDGNAPESEDEAFEADPDPAAEPASGVSPTPAAAPASAPAAAPGASAPAVDAPASAPTPGMPASGPAQSAA
jgi:phospholipid-binding lipoprotein MlaA